VKRRIALLGMPVLALSLPTEHRQCSIAVQKSASAQRPACHAE
jgi:hypothetical protein